jgi:spermidine synthase
VGDPSAPSIQKPSTLARAEFLVTVFATGAAVLIIEILGTRVVGPVFGVNLFVWAALLTVTLGSLGGGYYAGGVLVDRAPTPRLLGLVVMVAGLLLCPVPLIGHAVLGFAERFGPRGGPLVSASLLFTPSLLALGMTGPIAVRLSTRDLRGTGRGVGGVYAVSTLGSLAATLLTSFVLVPALDTQTILLGTATLLILVGAVLLALRRRPWVLAGVLAPLLASTAPQSPLPHGIEVVDHSQSLYGLLEVIDDNNRGFRLLRADHSIIGAEFMRDHSAGFSFLHLLEAVQLLRPQAKDMLQIGLGIGSLPSVLARRGIRTDVVEIDPGVVRFARRYFGFSAPGQTYVEDARTFLRHCERRYDLVVHDTFTGGTTPEHLLSIEVIKSIRNILHPGGVLALNFVGYQDGPNAEASWAVARTLRAVFPRVRVFRDSPPDEHPDVPANLIFFASDGDLHFDAPTTIAFENSNCARTLRSFQSWEVLTRVPDGGMITDEHNDLARLELPVAEAHYHAMNELLPAEVWLHSE